jgi:tripartite-type tricarboxylate transporter receptor subunit TctC
MEMLKTAAGIDLIHVPYKGSHPAVVDLIGGQVSAAFFVPGNILEFVKDGRAKVIASTGQRRFAATPELPTMIEQGYEDFVALSWIGFLAPGGTPKPIIDRYNKELVRILHMPEIRAKLQQMEFDLVAGTPEQFAQWIRSEITRWGKVIKDTGAKAD